MPDYQKVEIPRGTFIGWGPKPGQEVEVKVMSFDAQGGKDFNGNVVPQLIGSLVSDCVNYRDKGTTKETIKAGELVTVNGGLDNLKRGLLAVQPPPGSFVKMVFESTTEVDKGTVKNIDIFYAPGHADDDDL